MSFSKFLDRLIWLGIVMVAIVAVGITSILALVIGVEQVRVGFVISGALLLIIFVMLAHATRHRPVRHAPRPADPNTGQFSPAEARWVRQPLQAAPQSPQMLWQPPEPVAQDAIKVTRPIQRPQITEPPQNPEEDTKPTPSKPMPVYTFQTAGRGLYDDLFPPPKPGDEDYLEYDQEATVKASAHRESPPLPLPLDEQPTPIGPVTPTIEQPGARFEELEQADQPDEPGEPVRSDPSDSEAPVPPDNFPA